LGGEGFRQSHNSPAYGCFFNFQPLRLQKGAIVPALLAGGDAVKVGGVGIQIGLLWVF
jgi:hypothetical protein